MKAQAAAQEQMAAQQQALGNGPVAQIGPAGNAGALPPELAAVLPELAQVAAMPEGGMA
jgi:hypothetical protein